MFYFCNVSSGGAATKVIGRSQTLSVEAPCRCLRPVEVDLQHGCAKTLNLKIDLVAMDFPLSIVNCG